MAVFGRIPVDPILFHFIFNIFSGAMQVGISYLPGDRYGMAGVWRELDRIAVKFPVTAISSRQLY